MRHAHPISDVLPASRPSPIFGRFTGTGREPLWLSPIVPFQGPAASSPRSASPPPSPPRWPASPRSRSRCASLLPSFLPRRMASSSPPSDERHWPALEIRTRLRVSFLSFSSPWLVRIGCPRLFVMYCAADLSPSLLERWNPTVCSSFFEISNQSIRCAADLVYLVACLFYFDEFF
jgi:hypothetical protein